MSNKSFEDSIEIKEPTVGISLTHWARKLEISICTVEKEGMKYGRRKRQTGGFHNRYDFAFAGRETVNQVAEFAPGVIEAATNDIDKIAKEWINQVFSQGGKEVDHVLPKILRGAIEDIYQTPFRLFRNLE